MASPLLAHAGDLHGGPWAFSLHPDVLLLLAAMAGGYWWALTFLGPRHAPAGQPAATRKQVASWAAGTLLLFAAAWWPAHDIGEEYLFSVHMAQHMVFTLVAPAFLIVGTPAWLLRLVLSPRWLGGAVKVLARPLPAGLLFNFGVAFTHWPSLVDFVLRSEPAHFLAHVFIFTTALLMWFPALNKVPEYPMLGNAGKMAYLFAQSVLPNVPVAFITFAEAPVYRFYAEAPRAFGIGAVEDQQVAGALMKVGGTAIMWTVICVLFMRWFASEQRTMSRDVLTWADVQAELERTPAPAPNGGPGAAVRPAFVAPAPPGPADHGRN